MHRHRAENEKEGTFQSPPVILSANILPKAVIHKIFSQILHQKPIFNIKPALSLIATVPGSPSGTHRGR
jgi:hypothetical protein